MLDALTISGCVWVRYTLASAPANGWGLICLGEARKGRVCIELPIVAAGLQGQFIDGLSPESRACGVSGILPILWTPSLMRYREHGHLTCDNLIHHRVWKMLEVAASDLVVVFGPIVCRGSQSVDGIKQFGAKRVRGYRASASASGSTSTSKVLKGY
jgi:hypothetical protein